MNMLAGFGRRALGVAVFAAAMTAFVGVAVAIGPADLEKAAADPAAAKADAKKAAADAKGKAVDAGKAAKAAPAEAKKAAKEVKAAELVNLNTAKKEAIAKLPGIGPVKAQAIIEGRPYKTKEDVMKVRGVKEGIYKKLESLITVQ
jgi:competence protein ComEA